MRFWSELAPPVSAAGVIIAEPWPEHWPRSRSARNRIVAELLESAGTQPSTAQFSRSLLRKRLPVDIRHNAKIFRAIGSLGHRTNYQNTVDFG